MSVPGTCRALLRAGRASAAVEFAMVAPILVLMLLFLMEMGYDLYAQEALEYGLQSAARAVQTGQAQNAASPAAFKTLYVCPAIGMLLPCASVSVDVRAISGDYFANGNAGTVPKNGNGQLDTSGYQYCPGSPNRLMLVQAIYAGPTFLGLLIPSMATPAADGNVHVTMASDAFINENYPVTSAPPAGC